MKRVMVIILSIISSIMLMKITAQTPTWADDIAPIFFNKCTKCHHNGGIAPFSLTDYNSAFIWRNSIKYDVQNGIMPPWPPDTSYTRFVGERTLTPTEIQKIADWVDGGAPSGNLSNAPAPPTYTNVYQLPGTPDLIVKIPPYTSNATTYDEYVCFSIPINNPNLLYVKAAEIVPGNPSIVHHVIVTADTSSSRPTIVTTYSNCYNAIGQFGIAGYDPGSGPVVLPSVGSAKFGIPLYPNCNIVFQMHYPKGSVGQLDTTQIRLFFYSPTETGIREVHTVPLLQNWSLNIPSNNTLTFTNECPTSGYFTNCQFPFPLTVLAANPHQHLIGKSIVNYVVSPSLTDTVKLIRINQWNFNWQGYYFYKKPVIVPFNYKWIGYHTYDNTSTNPHNPNNPPQTIYAGYQTSDEMFFDSFMLTYYQPGDENLNIDSLMTVSIQEFYKEKTNPSILKVYPIPAYDEIFISYEEKQKLISPSIQIKDIQGRTILHTDKINRINVSHLQAGIYFIELNDNNHIVAIQKLILIH